MASENNRARKHKAVIWKVGSPLKYEAFHPERMLINRLSMSYQHLGIQKGRLPWSHSILCLVTLVLRMERLNRWEQTKVMSRANHQCSIKTRLKIFCFLYLVLSVGF